MFREAASARDRFGEESFEHLCALVDVGLLCFQTGKLEQAEKSLDAAQRIALRREDPRPALDAVVDAVLGAECVPARVVARLLWLRAERAAGADGAAFEELQWLPDEELVALLEALVTLARDAPDREAADLVAALSAQLARVVTSRLPARVDLLRSLHRVSNRAAFRARRFELRLEPLLWLRDDSERRGEGAEASLYDLDLALAFVALHRNEDAARAYERAIARARALGAGEALRRALCDFGVVSERWGHGERAEALLREAVSVAEASAPSGLGEPSVALGLYLFRAGRRAEATTWLERGRATLALLHPLSIVARSHLAPPRELPADSPEALEVALGEALTTHLQREAPGLVREVRVWREAGTRRVHVSALAPLTPEERAQVEPLLERALREFDAASARLA